MPFCPVHIFSEMVKVLIKSCFIFLFLFQQLFIQGLVFGGGGVGLFFGGRCRGGQGRVALII